LRTFPDKAQTVVPEDRVAEGPGQIVAEEGVDLILAEAGDALSPAERMENAPAAVRNEPPPERVEQPVRKKVDVEVHERLPQALQPRRHQAVPALPVFFSRLASFFSFTVLEGFFLTSFLTSLSFPMSFPPVKICCRAVFSYLNRPFFATKIFF
jgi:hypothetical protein